MYKTQSQSLGKKAQFAARKRFIKVKNNHTVLKLEKLCKSIVHLF